MKTAVIGYPRIGKNRELKFALEHYFRKEKSYDELEQVAKQLRKKHWTAQQQAGISFISSNDFSYYDTMLDTMFMLNAIPRKYKRLDLSKPELYFAMARGYQGVKGDVTALAMKKWFHTNYHYLVPELESNMKIQLNPDKILNEYQEAKSLGIETKPVVIGPFTFLKLAHYEERQSISDFIPAICQAYKELLNQLEQVGVSWVQLDEPEVVRDLSSADIQLLLELYHGIVDRKYNSKILLQTYFGDVRDCYHELTQLNVDALGLDFVEGTENKKLVLENGFPKDKILFAGVVNGKNIWKCSYSTCLDQLEQLKQVAASIVVSTSCSLLHVPYSLEPEGELAEFEKDCFAFAKEKLIELKDLGFLADCNSPAVQPEYIQHEKMQLQRKSKGNERVRNRIKELCPKDFERNVKRQERKKIQQEEFHLPLFPTTTIGSFPQTAEVKRVRSQYRKGMISKAEYESKIFQWIKECIQLQEKLGLDVLVHGEYERNDMVEYFGQQLEGYVFTKNGWVQSYGTRCVKPPIIFSDIERKQPMTVKYLNYAKQWTNKPVKGMLTGPVTMLNWSFPREDIELKEMAYQLAIAIGEEVIDLEAAGVTMIQIDEAALKEKLPLRKVDWQKQYLDWAIPAFRLCSSNVKATTQIHTHMCYSEFDQIIEAIDEMDADVISFEASRSKLEILDGLKQHHFETQVGPGVYDIHSPRIPSEEEFEHNIKAIIDKIAPTQIWINPDCGLKTRQIKETVASLANMVEATKKFRR